MVTQKGKRVGNVSYRLFFGKSYDKIREWALHLTQNDTEFCDRVIEKAFIKLTQNNSNLFFFTPETYLYLALRNAYLSRIRKKGSETVMSLLDIDLVTDSFLLPNLDNQANLINQLWAICEYCCLRKENSIAGSIIILSFFYGYKLSEIELITKRSKKTLQGRLFSAKRELSRFFEHPQRYFDQEKTKDLSIMKIEKDFSIESVLSKKLKARIYENRKGDCFHLSALREIYFGDKPIECKALSHFVSCPTCLRKINKILNLCPPSKKSFLVVFEKTLKPETAEKESLKSLTSINPAETNVLNQRKKPEIRHSSAVQTYKKNKIERDEGFSKF